MRHLTLLKGFFLVISCSLLLSACDQFFSEETIAKSYLTAISDGDFEKAIRLIYMPQRIQEDPAKQGEFRSELFDMFEKMKRNFFDVNGGIDSVEFSNKTYTNTREVTLNYQITFENGVSTNGALNLRLDNRTWRVRAK